MALQRRVHGALTAWNTTSQAVPYSASATAGDACFLIAENTVAIDAAPAGWTELASGGPGNGYYTKVFRLNGNYTGTPAQPTLTATGSAGGVAYIEHWYDDGGLAIDSAAQVALDTTLGSTAFSATGTSITTVTGDTLLAALGLKSATAMTAAPTTIVLLQAGATLGTNVANFGTRTISGTSPATSFHVGTYHKPVTTGGTGAPSMTATGGTGATDVGGTVAVIRMRGVAANTPPVANAGTDQSVTVGNLVTLDGTGSSDPDGTIASYLWSQTAGTAVTLSSTTAASPTFTPATAGARTFQLQVTDNGGATHTDTVVITVNAANVPPTANAGTDQDVAVSTLVTLNGTGSTDPDGTIATYAWTQTAGTAVTLSSTSAVSPTFTPATTGVRTFELVVTDNLGAASAADSVTITVSAGNVASNSGTSGATLSVNKPAGLADGDLLGIAVYKQAPGTTFTTPSGFTAAYAAVASGTRGLAVFFKPITSASGEPSSYSITASDSGSRWIAAAFRLTGIDSAWLDAAPTSDAYNSGSATTVVDPSVTAVAPATLALALNFSNNSSAVYQSFTSSGWTNIVNATVTSGASTSVLDVASKTLSATGATGTTTFTMSPAAASSGGFQLTLKLPGGNFPPTANAGTDQTVTAGTLVTLNGTGSTDTDGTVASYAWTQTAGTAVTLSSSTATSPTFTPATAGTRTFSLVVTDNLGAVSAADTVDIVVNAAPGIIRKWSGDGLTAGTLTTASVGTDDNAFNVVNGTPLIVETSPRSPQIEVVGAAQDFRWSIPAQTEGAGRFYYTTPAAWPSASGPIMQTVYNGTTASLGIYLGGTSLAGSIRLYNASTMVTSTANGTIFNSTRYRFEWLIDHGAGSATIKCYVGDGSTEVASLTGSAAFQASHNVVAFGYPNAAPAFDTGRFDDMAVSSTATLIGPAGSINLPPTANAGTDQNVTAGTAVTLNGTGSADPDGTITGYLWSQTSGTAVTLSSTSVASPTFTPATAGVRVFQLQVTDNIGASAADTVTITVNAASAGTISYVGVGAAGTLSTAGTFTYPAALIAGDMCIAYAHSNVNALPATIAGWTESPGGLLSAGGVYARAWYRIVAGTESGTTFTYSGVTGGTKGIVLMNAFRSSTGFFTSPVDVSGTDSDSSTNAFVAFGDPAPSEIGDRIASSLAAFAVSATFTGAPTAQTITQGGGGVVSTTARTGSGSSFGGTVTYGSADAGVTTGGTGPVGYSANTTGSTAAGVVRMLLLHATGTPSNVPPTANAGVDQTVATGALVTLNGTASADSDGTIASYAWTQTSGTTVTLSSNSVASPTFTPATSGVRVFRLIVTDDDGAVSAADTVTITVNTPPTANAGPDQTVPVGTLVTLTGAASSDPDGSIASYTWVQTSGTAATLSSPSAVSPTFTPASAGIQVFSLIVTDNLGATSAQDTVAITATAGDVANAGADQSVPAFDTVTLTGSGTSTGVWTQVSGAAVTLIGSGATNFFKAIPSNTVGASVVRVFRYTVGTATDDVTVTTATATLWYGLPLRPAEFTMDPNFALGYGAGAYGSGPYGE